MSYEIDLDENSGTVQRDGFKDPEKVFPRKQYMGQATTNYAARGIKRNNLYIGGGHVALDLGLRTGPVSQYPLNQVRESISGHVTEIDDTPGNERMLFRHKTGAGVEMRPDGTVIISSVNNTIRVSGGDEKVVIEGNGEIFYNGNLKLNVAGDFDLNVGGNYNIVTGGDKVENIKGGVRQTITKNYESTVIQNKTEYVAGSMSETILRDKTSITKGASAEYVEGNKEIFVGYKDPDDGTGDLVGDFIITTTNTFTTSADNINVLARDLTATGDEGIMGGENIIMHNYNMYTGHSVDIGDTLTVPTIYNDTQVTSGHMNIPVVYGDLQGTATRAIDADTAHSQSYGDFHGDVGSSPGYTAATDTTADIPVDATTRVLDGSNSTTATTRVNSAEADEYLHKGSFGTRNVRIDISDDLKNAIDKTTPYGNLSSRKLSTPEIRAKLRDAANMKNTDFTSAQVTEGKLAADYASQTPNPFNVGRTVNRSDSKQNGKNIIGNAKGGGVKTVVGSGRTPGGVFNVDPAYNPERAGKITPHTKLAPGITMAKFLGGYGSAGNMNHITDDTERLDLAKNYAIHASFMRKIETNQKEFNNHRMVVVEGLYKPAPNEEMTIDDINYLKSKGRAVVYELRGLDGLISQEKTFDAAKYLRENSGFEKMIIGYDRFNPDGSLTTQLTIITPVIVPSWEVSYANQLETRYNHSVLTTGELQELL